MNTPKKKSLTIEAILEKISEFDIFKMYISDLKIGRAFCSPVRNDTNPSAIVYLGNDGKLRYKDFTESGTLDCVDLVMKMFLLDYDKALHKIDADFGLGISNGKVGDYKKIINSYSKPVMVKARYTFLQAESRKFTKADLEYWSQYGITVDELKRENIYSIKNLWCNRQKLPLPKDDLVFGYLYPEINSWKIYRPLQDKKNKWLSNVPLSHVYHLENLDKGKNTLIAKSLKDYICLKKIYENVVAIQNESLAALPEDKALYIKENSKTVFYSGDCDMPGKAASYKITEKYSYKHLNPPDSLMLEGGKDWADWMKLEGKDIVRAYLKRKKVMI